MAPPPGASVAGVTLTSTGPAVGDLLRTWRQRRRLSQLDLSNEAGVSARHLSFLETGRARPSREMVLHLAEQLEVPLRERNELLLAAGFAPVYGRRPLDAPDMAAVRTAVDLVLEAYEPYPVVVVDRGWQLVAGNRSLALLTAGADADLLEPPVNVLRVGLHPRGAAPLIANLGEWKAYFLSRLERQVALTGDQELAALLEQVAAYRGSDPQPPAGRAGSEIRGPLKVRAPDGGALSFFGMFATFDTPFEVTTSELAMELLFPADQATAEALAERARSKEAQAEAR